MRQACDPVKEYEVLVGKAQSLDQGSPRADLESRTLKIFMQSRIEARNRLI